MTNADMSKSFPNVLDSSTKDDSSPAPTFPPGSQRRVLVKGPPPSFSQPHMKTVVVKVGKDKVPFTLYKAFLVHYSPYFQAAFNGSFAEASTGIIELGDTTPEVFGLCVEWIMTQQIKETHRTEEQKNLSKAEQRRIERPTMDSLVRLWILANYLGIHELQNKSIDMIVMRRSRFRYLPTTYITLIYKESMPDSPLRRLFVDFCAWSTALEGDLAKYPQLFPPEMLIDLALAQARRISNPGMPNPRNDPKNYYVATERHDVTPSD